MSNARGEMQKDGRPQTTTRERLRLECRECPVICERVVSPWQCLRERCRYIYAYNDKDTTYFGCLYKVFLPELDLAAFAHASTRGADPYGSLRIFRRPLPHCPVSVEQAYPARYSDAACCNPTFYHGHACRAGEEISFPKKLPPDAVLEDLNS